MEEYHVRDLAIGDKVLVEIKKGIYGLLQAGWLAKDQLTVVLNKGSFFECEHTPCLFCHNSRDIVFSLAVDDFGVKRTDPGHRAHRRGCGIYAKLPA